MVFRAERDVDRGVHRLFPHQMRMIGCVTNEHGKAILARRIVEHRYRSPFEELWPVR